MLACHFSNNVRRMRPIKNKYALIIWVMVTVLMIAVYHQHFTFIEKFALGFEDLKFSARRSLGLEPEGSKEVVIVAVDERSVNKMGRFPWHRKVIGDLFAKLNQAELVGLDIIFADPTDAKQDTYLADVLAANNNVVAGFFFRPEASEPTTPEHLEALQKCSYNDVDVQDKVVGVGHFPFAEVNITPIADAAVACAFFNNEPDADGMYRRYPLTYIHEGYFFPSLAVQLMRWHLNKEAKLILDSKGVKSFRLGPVLLEDQNRFLFNYPRQRKETFVSAVDVYTGQIAPAFFRDKIVLVGLTEMGLYDLRPTPINRMAPGVWLHYTALSNLLNNDMLRPSMRLDTGLIVLSLLLITIVSLIHALWLRLALYGGVICAVLVLSNTIFIMGNIWLREFYLCVGCVFLSTILEVKAFIKTELRATELKRAFSSYVSPEVVSEILKNPDRLELGGSEREISVLFSDIRGFTAISEKMTPKELVSLLNQIHGPLTHVIIKNRGLLDKYIGDAMMALFNAPLDIDHHADLAVQSALEMVKVLSEINEKMQRQGGQVINIGIGINTGACVVGNIGSTVRLEYTAIGDSVNLASRLEGLCKIYGARIIISDSTCTQLTAGFLVRKLDLVRVKGRKQPVAIFEVLEDSPQNREVRAQFEAGLALYFASDFFAAAPLFTELAEKTADPVAAIFAGRCEQFINKPPPPEWDGVYTMTSK